MSRLHLYLISCFILLCATSCPDEPPCAEQENVLVFVSDGKRFVAYPFQSVYGIGGQNKGSIQRIANSGFSSGLDTGFYLPLNVNDAHCRFVFLRTDGSSDTIGLKYTLKFHVDEERCGFQFDLDDVSIQSLSDRFNKDSSTILDLYYNRRINLRLK